MPATRPALVLALCLLLITPGLVAAQPAAPRFVSAFATPAGPAVDLPCPPGAQPTMALNGRAPRPAVVAPAPSEPVAIALVVETSPAMAGPSTPHSTALADAITLATALLDRAPVGSRLALVTFDRTPQLALALDTDRVRFQRAVASLAAAPAADAAPPDLAAALQLAARELEGADSGRRAILALTASGQAAPEPAAAAEYGLLVVALGSAGAVAAAPTLPFVAADVAMLPERFTSFDRALDELLGRNLVRVMLPVAGLERGEHQALIAGCGEAVVAAFTLGGGLPLPAAAGAVAVVLALAGMALLLQQRHQRQRASERSSTSRFQPVSTVTTARRGAQTTPLGLCVVVWDGHERRVHRLARRQTTVGRDQGCDLRIESEWVSGLHARLSIVGDRVEIVDLGSTNGTFLCPSGRPLVVGTPEPLVAGAEVLLGAEVRLTLEAGELADGEEPL